MSGTPTKKGPITVKLHVEISSVATPYDLTAESRAKLAGEVTVTMFKLLPRLAVLDWGDYEKGTGTNFNNGTPRSFSFGLALEEEGDNLRNYTSKTADWLTASSMFFAHNRFAFGNLQPGTTYWFWIVAHYPLNIFSEIPFYRLSLYISYLQMFSFGLNTHEISLF